VENTSRRLKIVKLVGKILVALASVPIFLYAVESARGLVRILGGIPSFLSLVAIIVLGIAELIWLVVVLDRQLPARPERRRATFLRYIGTEASALFVLGVTPGLIISLVANIPLTTTLTTLEQVILPISLVAAVACFVVAGYSSRRPAE
jgi:hypothetical protein